MAYVIWDEAITWLCPECKTRNFHAGEEFDLDDENDLFHHRMVCDGILDALNAERAEASPDLPPITFAQAESHGIFNSLTRPPKVVTCTKCENRYDCFSEDDSDEIEPGN